LVSSSSTSSTSGIAGRICARWAGSDRPGDRTGRHSEPAVAVLGVGIDPRSASAGQTTTENTTSLPTRALATCRLCSRGGVHNHRAKRPYRWQPCVAVGDGCEVTDAGVSARVVPGFDPLENRLGQLGFGVPPPPVEEFTLHGGPKRLDHRVIHRGDSSHRAEEAGRAPLASDVSCSDYRSN
jgi:hypothetical protein